jgi:hypothetical protein
LNPGPILMLISNIYEQLMAALERITELEKQLEATNEPS